jgi:ubiquinone/menaquinone biosynthesis C-methylase UbiE
MVEGMARTYPRSTFVGFDTDTTSLERAINPTRSAGLANVTFQRIGQSGLPVDRVFDFILAIDVIQDVAHPTQVLIRVRQVLREGGTFLLIEPDAAESSPMQPNDWTTTSTPAARCSTR